MSHCDPQLTDFIQLAPFQQNPIQAFHDTAPTGSGSANGVVSNGTYFAAAYVSSPELKVYDTTGAIVYSSTIADASAPGFTPMMGTDGGVIAGDDTQIFRLGPTGTVLWDTCWYAGTAPACKCSDGTSSPPCTDGVRADGSSTQLTNGSIVVSLNGSSGHGGKIFNINSSTGAILSGNYLGGTSANSYVGNNTPAVGTGLYTNRIYVITNWSADPTLGRMYALDYDVAGVMTEAWHYDFHGPSQASPTVIGTGVFADGDSAAAHGEIYGWQQADGTLIFACKDSGGTGCTVLPTIAPASFAADSRGGFWTFAGGNASYHGVTRRSTTDGSELQFIDVGHIVPGESCTTFIGSAISVGTLANAHNVLIHSLHGLTACGGGNYVVAIDANTSTLLWAYRTGTFSATHATAGIFPIALNSSSKPLVGFTLKDSGMIALKELINLSFLKGSGVLFGSGVLHN